MRKSEAKAEGEFAQTRGLIWLWAGFLVAPLAFLLHLNINYRVVQSACQSKNSLLSHLTTLLFLLIAVGGSLIALGNWKATGQVAPGEEASILDRSRFMAVVGLLVSALIVLALIAQWIAQFFIEPCQR